MTSRATAIGGSGVALFATLVLLATFFGSTTPARFGAGWRVMVAPTAFAFVCLGLACAVAGVGHVRRSPGAWIVRALAATAVLLPMATLAEYAFEARWRIETWLVPSLVVDPTLDAYAGRMSAMTAMTFVLIAIAVVALTFPTPVGASVVRWAGGTTLMLSWLAVIAVSFERDRLNDLPRFPGMAVPTVILFAVTSVLVLSSSATAMARLRAANADIGLDPRLLVGAFALPIVLGRAHLLLARRVDPGLATALVTATFASIGAIVMWRAAGRMFRLRSQREALRTDLEQRVRERTRALAEANAELERSQAQLRESDQRKDEFLATLAHELRNPLAPIRTSVELLKSPTLPAAVRQQSQEIIARQMRHLVRLIDDLLDVSRITAGKLVLQRTHVDLRDVVAQAVETARDTIDGAGHTCTVEAGTAAVVVDGDLTRLTQVTANLLLNACKFTPRGGRISVQVSVVGGSGEVRVRDSGMGIPAEFLPRVFEKFAQAASAPGGVDGGLGLGLALVKALVQLHGGTVAVKSDGPGLGTEFAIRLPVVVPDAPRVDAFGTAEPDSAMAPQRVLIADDNLDPVHALAAWLRQRGHEVVTVGDGRSALEQVERWRPSLVLLDLGMPHVNGLEVCRAIRSQTWGRAIRIVAQTGWGQAADRKRSREAGFDLHLVKPVDPAELERVMVEPVRPSRG